MPNENLRVIALINNKGGSGKTTLAMIFGSVALAGNARVGFVDMDPMLNLTKWVAAAREHGLWAEGAELLTSEDPDEVAAWIDVAYDSDRLDYIFVDTPGFASDRIEAAVLMADHVVSPILTGANDVRSALDMRDWFAGLAERVSGGDVPPVVFVLNAVADDLPDRLPVAQREAYRTIRSELPTTPTTLRRAADYGTMAARGPLYALAVNRELADAATVRITARSAHKALARGADVLNEVLGGELYLTREEETA